jgi:hypothetical protein
MVVGKKIPRQSVTITTKVVSSNTANGTRVLDTTLCDVYFSDLRPNYDIT